MVWGWLWKEEGEEEEDGRMNEVKVQMRKVPDANPKGQSRNEPNTIRTPPLAQTLLSPLERLPTHPSSIVPPPPNQNRTDPRTPYLRGPPPKGPSEEPWHSPNLPHLEGSKVVSLFSFLFFSLIFFFFIFFPSSRQTVLDLVEPIDRRSLRLTGGVGWLENRTTEPIRFLQGHAPATSVENWRRGARSRRA